MKSIVLPLLLVGIIFVLPLLQVAFAQTTGIDQMIREMRFTHSQLAGNIDEIKQLIKSNSTSEVLNLLEGMKIKTDHMKTMFNDLTWEFSNKGH
jgi:hypothetical protein